MKTGKILEAIQHVNERGNDFIMANDLLEFLNGIPENRRERIFIKYIEQENNQDLPTVINVSGQFANGSDCILAEADTNLQDTTANNGHGGMATVQKWIADLTEDIRQIGNVPVKVYKSTDTNRRKRFSLIFEDTSNVIYVAAIDSNRIQHAEAFISSATSYISSHKLDATSLAQKINADGARMHQQNVDALRSLIPACQRDLLNAEQQAPAGDAENQNDAENRDNAGNQEQQQAQANDQNQADQGREQPANQTPQANDQTQNNTQANAEPQPQTETPNAFPVRIDGEFNASENWRIGEYDVLMSPMTPDQILADMKKIPEDVLKKIFPRPLKYKSIDIGRDEPDVPDIDRQTKRQRVDRHGRPKTRKTPYMQVKDNYKYWYVFSNTRECVWKRTKQAKDRIGEGVIQIKDLRPDLFNRMMTNSGNSWVYAFFLDTTGEKNMSRINVLWSSAGSFPKTSPSNAASPEAQAEEKENEEYEKSFIRKILINALGGLDANGNTKWYIRDPIKNGTKRKTLIDVQKDRLGRPTAHYLNRNDIDTLIEHKNDWTIRYSAVNTTYDNYMRQLVTTIRTALNCQVPPKYVPPMLSADDTKKMQDTLAAAKSKISDVGVDVQIVEPGFLPKYNFILGLPFKQGQGWPKDEHRYFAVLFPGVCPDKLVGEEAEKYIEEMGLGEIITPAWEEAKKTYEGIRLCIGMDNGIEKT